MSRWQKMVWASLPFLAAPSFANAATYFNTVFNFDISRTKAGLVAGADGALYGTTPDISFTSGGMIYRTTIDGANPQNWYQLGDNEGHGPSASLLASSDGYFYGTTQYGAKQGLNYQRGSGTVFKISQTSKVLTTLHTFADISSDSVTNADGAAPNITLIEGPGGYLYGAALAGGANGTGTVFRLLKDGSGFQVLHHFGTLDANAANSDGATPNGKLLVGSDSRLYGVTQYGGAAGKGVVYSLDPSGTSFEAIHQFSALDDSAHNADGVTPQGALVQVGSTLYGVTTGGGTAGLGTVYSLVTDGSAANTTLTTLHNFTGIAPDGAVPLAGLTYNPGTTLLYGTTSTGGANADNTSNTVYGSIFSISLDGAAYDVYHIFDGANGVGPQGELLELGSGTYFGTTIGTGGACGYGTVFRFSLNSPGTDGHSSCETYDTGGGGSMAPGLLLLLSGLGMAPAVRRRWNSL